MSRSGHGSNYTCVFVQCTMKGDTAEDYVQCTQTRHGTVQNLYWQSYININIYYIYIYIYIYVCVCLPSPGVQMCVLIFFVQNSTSWYRECACIRSQSM